MQIKIILAFIFSILVAFNPGCAQELKKKKSNTGGAIEEYYVLKENKNIKQGQSLSYRIDALDRKYLVQFGQFTNNIKTGKWLEFYFQNPSNFLKASGYYDNGKKHGNWRHYFPGSTSEGLSSLFGSEKRTLIEKENKDIQSFHVKIDSIGQPLMASGEYAAGKKTGVGILYVFRAITS